MKGSFLSRRQFLKQFGAVSGSSFVLGAMDAWALSGTTAGRKPELPRTSRETRVLVLGAGLSGMAAAWELGKLGHDVRVLEARDRVGGVSHTIRRGTEETETTGVHQVCEFDEGLYFNSGPWRIPNTHSAVLGYCRELGVPLQVFINEHDDAILYYEGEEYGSLSGKRVRLREVKADMRGYTSELLSKAVSQDLLDLPLTGEDIERLLSYLVNEGYLATPDNVYRGSRARGEEAPYDMAALLRSGFVGRVRSVDNVGNTRPPMFQPIGGMDQIPMAFGRALGDRITLNAEVVTIRQTEDEVRVEYLDTRTGMKHEVTAEYLVCCIPLSVLSGIDAGLSPAMSAAVAGVRYSPSAKIGLQMRRRFWEEDDGIYGGASYTNLPLGQFAYPSNDFFSSKGVLLGYYGNGTTANLQDRPAAERIAHVIDNAKRFHPQLPAEFETGYAKCWSNIKYSNGAYASGSGDLGETLRTPEGRIYLGCAALSSSPGWMEGAFSAAWDTVERLHGRVLAA
jgi:monoamine oxidase